MPHRHHRPLHNIMFHKVIPNSKIESIQDHLIAIAESIAKGKLKIDQDEVNIPREDLNFSIKHERNAKGDLALKIEIKWTPESGEEVMVQSSLEIS